MRAALRIAALSLSFQRRNSVILVPQHNTVKFFEWNMEDTRQSHSISNGDCWHIVGIFTVLNNLKQMEPCFPDLTGASW